MIREFQEEHNNSIGYRPMTRLISEKIGKKVNSKRIRKLMKENDLLSAVRRRKWSEEVYAKRRELKASIPPDLIKQRFFASEPRKKMVIPCLKT